MGTPPHDDWNTDLTPAGGAGRRGRL